MDNSGISFHSQIGSKDFLSKMIGLLKSRDSPDIQIKILGLIKKWGDKFESNSDILPNFQQIYKNLLNNGVSFPNNFKSEYSKYTQSQGKGSISREINRGNSNSNIQRHSSNKSNSYDDQNNQFNQGMKSNSHGLSNEPIKLNPDDYKKKYKKFVVEMNIVIDNIQLANQIIDSMSVGDEVDESLRSIMLNLKNCESGLLKAIQTQITDENLLSNCLMLNDDLNQTSERYNFIKSGNKPSTFVSAFGWTTYEETEVKKNSLKEKKISSTKIQSVKAPTDDIFGLFDNMTVSSSNNQGFGFGNQPINNTNNNVSNNSNMNDFFSQNQPVQNKVFDINDLINNFGNSNQQPKQQIHTYDFVSTDNKKPKLNDLLNVYDPNYVHVQNNNQSYGQQGRSQGQENFIDFNQNQGINQGFNQGQGMNLGFQQNQGFVQMQNMNQGINQGYNQHPQMQMQHQPQQINNLQGNFQNPKMNKQSEQIVLNKGNLNTNFDILIQSDQPQDNYRKKDKLEGLNPFA